MSFQVPGTSSTASDAFGATDAGVSYLRQVFAWMFLGLGITTAVAVYFSSTANVTDYFNDHPIIYYVLIGAQLAMVFGLSLAINKINGTVAAIMFCVYAALTGATFSILLEIYTTGSVVGAFAGACGVFGGMALVGYTTKKDLSKLGPVLFGALIGLIVASVVFIFVGGSTFNLILGWGGVIIFSGLTMYDMQQLKKMGAENMGDHDTVQKYAIFGALRLYLDFINLFLSLLRIFGNQR